MIKVEDIVIEGGLRYIGEKDKSGVKVTNSERAAWPTVARLSDMSRGTVIIEDYSGNSIGISLEEWDVIVKHIAERRALLLSSSVVE